MVFDFEYNQILENLALLEDRGFKLPCPIRCEKYASKIIGYAKERFESKKDQKIMTSLINDMGHVRDIVRTNPKKEVYTELTKIVQQWRKIIQGIEEYKPHNVLNCKNGVCKNVNN
jgi:hypothetical protein